MPDETPIYVVDDDEAVRDSVILLLQHNGYVVRGFASGSAFLEIASSLRPGCLITDIRMPGLDGLALQQELIRRRLSFPLIVLTGHGDVPLAVRAIKAGAVDFVEKPFAAATILKSVTEATALLANIRDRNSLAVSAAARLASLTPRERDVLRGLLAGLPSKAIAYDLAISPRTVEVHRARVMDKMGARSLPELVRISLAAGVGAGTAPLAPGLRTIPDP